ncbi:MAG: AAA family ATPase [Sulfurovum sp.]
MQLELKNIGMIKEATVKINGLTVIAGENDTGKSTIGKVLCMLIKSIRWASNTHSDNGQYVIQFNKYEELLFENQISDSGKINFKYKSVDFEYELIDNSCTNFKISTPFDNNLSKVHSPLLIETPFVWNLSKTMTSIAFNELSSGIDFKVPLLLQDLFSALNMELTEKYEFDLNISSIINGNFKKRDYGDFFFEREGKEYRLTNVAMSIKYFGLLQVLENNGHLYRGQVLILEEPEAHLHPKWQLEMAKIIVELVKNGVKVVVNSHSSYMIDALKRYSKIEKIEDKTNFYLAENGHIDKVEEEQ